MTYISFIYNTWLLISFCRKTSCFCRKFDPHKVFHSYDFVWKISTAHVTSLPLNAVKEKIEKKMSEIFNQFI